MYVALSASYHKFVYLSTEEKRHKCMRQLVGELHKPIQIMAYFQGFQNNGEDRICDEARKQADIVSCMSPIPAYSDTYVNGVLSEGCNEHVHKKNSQQTKQSCRSYVPDSVDLLLHYSLVSSSTFNAAIQIPVSS